MTMITELHLSKQTFRAPPGEAFAEPLDLQQLVGKPFRAGDRSWEITAITETDHDVVITLGEDSDDRVQ